MQALQGFPGGSALKNLPAMQEMKESWVRFLVGEDPWEESKTTHSSIHAWRQRSLVGYSPWGCKEPDTTEVTKHAGSLRAYPEACGILVPQSSLALEGRFLTTEPFSKSQGSF